MGYVYIASCIAFTVYGQIVLKWRMNQNLDLPDSAFGKIVRLITLILTDPWIFSGLAAAFVASLFWMLAMTRFQISYAYPFMSSAFVLVLIISVPLFGETLNAAKLGGTALIILGIFVLSRGYAS
jgi:multidrug transporter EmrE-like cation transporter